MTSDSAPFYSGFSLCNETALFNDLIDTAPFCIAGFSYGAIRAFEHASKSESRIDKLQLFSPAFFQDRDEKYRRLQMMFYKKDAAAYTENFLKNCAYPSAADLNPFLCKGESGELEALLNYRWDEKAMQSLLGKGTKLEIHLGRMDKIIDAKKALAFFRPFGTIYFYQHAGHILKGEI